MSPSNSSRSRPSSSTNGSNNSSGGGAESGHALRTRSQEYYEMLQNLRGSRARRNLNASHAAAPTGVGFRGLPDMDSEEYFRQQYPEMFERAAPVPPVQADQVSVSPAGIENRVSFGETAGLRHLNFEGGYSPQISNIGEPLPGASTQWVGGYLGELEVASPSLYTPSLTIDPSLLHGSSPSLPTAALPLSTPLYEASPAPIPTLMLPTSSTPAPFRAQSPDQASSQPSPLRSINPSTRVTVPETTTTSTRPAFSEVDTPNHPTAGPSNSAARRAQPKRTRKRKQADRENVPARIVPDGRTKRQCRKGKQTATTVTVPVPVPEPSPVASAASSTTKPARARRKNDELELVETTPETRCRLDGCNHLLPDAVGKAREHMHTHFRKVAIPVVEDKSIAHSKQGERKKGRKGKNANASRKAARAKPDLQDKKTVYKYPCPYISADGRRCGDNPKHRYSDRLGLQRHIKSRHYGWKIRCPVCQRGFGRRGALKRHVDSKTDTCRPPTATAEPEAMSELEPGTSSGLSLQSQTESEADSETESDSDPDSD